MDKYRKTNLVMTKHDVLYVYTDGGSRGNPGPGAIAVVICDDSGNMIKEHCECIGETTNNRAEYTAIIKALAIASKISNGEIKFFSDSKLAINQLSGNWKVRDAEINPLFNKVKEEEKPFDKITYSHMHRENEKIQRADELVNNALDNQ
jgi:ribonuclease HI